jgi:hypothetical protein
MALDVVLGGLALTAAVLVLVGLGVLAVRAKEVQ